MSNTLAGVTLEQVSEQTLDLLGDNFWMFSLFARNFSDSIRERGDRTITRVPASVSVLDLSNGYTASDVTSTEIEIALSNFKGFSMAFTEFEISKAKSATILERVFTRPAIDATAKAVADDLLALVTPANFPTKQVRTAANFDSDDLADAAATMTTNKVPRGLRSCMLNPQYTSSLSKDGAIGVASAFGNPLPIQENIISTVHGFGISEYQGIPTANNLQGFYAHPSALCIAARQIARPTYGGAEILDVIEPRTGLPIQFRKFFSPREGKFYITCGILYGVAKGLTNSLIRITDI